MTTTVKRQRQRGHEKYGSGTGGKFGQEIGGTGGAEQAAGSTGAEGSAHVSAFAMLQQHQDNDGQRGNYLNHDDGGK